MKKKPEKYTKEWFAELGRQGGKKTKELYGLKHYSKMGKKKVDNLKKEVKEPINITT